MNSKDSERDIVNDHISYLSKNKNPLDEKADEFKSLHYIIEDYNTLDKFLNSIIDNTSYKGELTIESSKFDDNIGYKITKIIANNSISKLKIVNKNKPFSDRIAKIIGDVLENNTSLRSLEIFLDIGKFSPLHICKFLNNPNSSLSYLSHLKINKELFEYLAEFLNKSSKLNHLGFYYEPLIYIDLLYVPAIEYEIYYRLADRIQSESNLHEVEVIPIPDTFQEDINIKLTQFIYQLSETLKFSCEICRKEFEGRINIEKIYQEENTKMSEVM